MINIEAYLLNNDKRLLEITDTCYIGHLYIKVPNATCDLKVA